MAERFSHEPLHRHDLRADTPGKGRRPAARRYTGGFRVRRAYEPRPSLPRRSRRRRDGTARPRGQERTAARDRRRRARRRGPALGAPRCGLLDAPPRTDRAPMVWAQQLEETLRMAAPSSNASSRAPARPPSTDAVAAKAGFENSDEPSPPSARGVEHAVDPGGDRSRPAGGCEGGGGEPNRLASPEQGGGRRQRDQRSRCRPPDDGPRALLQAGAARRHRRLRHARQRGHDPSRELHDGGAASRTPARAPDHRRMGRASRRCIPGRCRAGGRGPAGLLRDVTEVFSARACVTANTLTRHAKPHGVHAGDAEPEAVQRALALVRDVRVAMSAARRWIAAASLAQARHRQG